MVNPWFPAGFPTTPVTHASTLRQIEALRKKLRILVDHNRNAPDLEKLAAQFFDGHPQATSQMQFNWSIILMDPNPRTPSRH